MGSVLTTLGGVQPGWACAAGLCFALAFLSSAAAWDVALRVCGGEASFLQVAARCAVGSGVNSIAPAHLGGALRLGLLSRTLPGSDRVLRTGGVSALLSAAR